MEYGTLKAPSIVRPGTAFCESGSDQLKLRPRPRSVKREVTWVRLRGGGGEGNIPASRPGAESGLLRTRSV